MKTGEKLYCSLDIETSGFDPLKNEILELGFVFFKLEKNGLKITEQWSKVFKPKTEVGPNILALTGIRQEELDTALEFDADRVFLQDKLGHATLVGHNISFDIKFLESNGLKLSGSSVDTLDLVQIILPTHHSYNLENLMHIFKLPHEDAHRALADSQAVIQLLDKLLRVFWSFPEKVREQIFSLAEQGSLPWTPLFSLPLSPLPAPGDKELPVAARQLSLKLETRTIYNLPLGGSCLDDLLEALRSSKRKILLVVPKSHQAITLWKRGAVQAEFAPELLFDETKFEKFLQKPDKTPDELKFILKILAWRGSNWQSKSIVDLNLSFFGGQFRSAISGREAVEQKSPGLVCCDLKTFDYLREHGLYRKRFTVFYDLSEFERHVTANMGAKVGWGQVVYLLKSFYNPEINSGQQEWKDLVQEGLAAADLFFGLVSMLTRSEGSAFSYFAVTDEFLHSQSYGKIAAAGENFAGALSSLAKRLDSPDLQTVSEKLKEFFGSSENYVRWIELADNRCVLHKAPLDISGLVGSITQAYPQNAFVDSMGSGKTLSFFAERLSLKDYEVENLKVELNQGELFKSTEQLESLKIHCAIYANTLQEEDLTALVQRLPLPAAVLFNHVTQISEFYQKNYQTLQEKCFILAQSNSGGSNKMFHNFFIHNNSLLLLTDKLVLKHLAMSDNVAPVEHLPVKSLIVCRLPFEQVSHPYQQALSARFSNAFEDFALPKAIYNFHKLIDFFYTESLEQIYICDPKLAKAYAKDFLEYLSSLPRVELLPQPTSILL